MKKQAKTFLRIGGGALALYAVVIFIAVVMQSSRRAPAGETQSEVIAPGEDDATTRILNLIQLTLQNDHRAQGGPMTRDAHAKHHGCVRGEFRVNPSLAPELRAGVFATPGASFPAWVRYSNGAGKAQADAKGDGRGMAIKLLRVPGEKLLDSERDAQTQDFLMINHPVFFVRNVEDYIDFTNASAAGNPLPFFFPSPNPFSWRLPEFGVVAKITSQKVTDPLALRYWTMTPYQFGQREAKFSARPCADVKLPALRASPDPDFLRANLRTHLEQADACYEFMVQLRTKPEAMPIEDPTVEWKESDSPFVSVARLTIPRQRFDAPAQMEFCENLSYTPWHSLPEHRPLGGINRVRRAVYEGISKLRHETNRAARSEPTGEERFE